MLDLDYKVDEMGNTTQYILLGMSPDHVKCLYGALLKERQSMLVLIENFKIKEGDESEMQVYNRLKMQYQNIDMLIAVIKNVC